MHAGHRGRDVALRLAHGTLAVGSACRQHVQPAVSGLAAFRTHADPQLTGRHCLPDAADTPGLAVRRRLPTVVLRRGRHSAAETRTGQAMAPSPSPVAEAARPAHRLPRRPGRGSSPAYALLCPFLRPLPAHQPLGHPSGDTHHVCCTADAAT